VDSRKVAHARAAGDGNRSVAVVAAFAG
jgi:hypothetical protein